MFGRKQEIIDNLRLDLTYVKERRDVYYKNWVSTADELARTKSELAIIQEAYSGRLNEIDELSARAAALETDKDGLRYELNEARLYSDNLREETEDTARMLELYKALVASLRIVIKLPARKK